MNLDDVADELYGLPPDEFIAARKAKVIQARQSGDRQLTTAIGGLRRPSATAALVNLLTRRQPDLIDDLLDLAAQLRQAQAARAGDDLRRLSTRRSQVVSALVSAGRELAAAEQHHPASAQVENELTATLQAALADPEAAEAVRSGRLTSALHYSGFGTVAGDDGVHSDQKRAQLPARPRPAKIPSAKADEALRDARASATAALAAAQGRLDELEQAAARDDDSVATERQRRRDAEERIAELERQLTAARDDERQAARQVRALEKDRDRAARAAAAARRRVEQAQQAVDRHAAD